MNNTPTCSKADQSAPSKRKFAGTDNPRHLRVLNVLLRRPVPRKEVDNIAGCANGPQLVADLRNLGLGEKHLPCERINFIDRDGFPCRPGVYRLTEVGRRMVNAWMAEREKRSIRKKFPHKVQDMFDGPL